MGGIYDKVHSDPSNITSVYKDCGLEIGQPVNIDHVVVTRCDDLFRSGPPADQDAPARLENLQRQILCTPPCTKLLTMAEQFCCQCGSRNGCYSEALGKAFGSHGKKGWVKPKPSAVEVEITDQPLYDAHQDLLKHLQSRKKKFIPQPDVEDKDTDKKKSEKHGGTVWKEWVRYGQSKAVDLKV